MEQHGLGCYMITYISDGKRLLNFESSRAKFKELQLFKAIVPNSKNTYQLSLFHPSFLSTMGNKKIGTALSHFEVQKLSISSGNKWTFVMEDDFEFESLSPRFFVNIINQAEKIGSSFVSFDCRPRFHKAQFQEQIKVGKFYKMIPQWGLGCYLANSEASKRLLELKPINSNIDIHWIFNNLCELKNPVMIERELNPFVNCGVEDYKDSRKSKYGSMLQKNDIKLL